MTGLAGIDEPFIWGGPGLGGGLVGGSVASAASWVNRALTEAQRPAIREWVRSHFSPIFERLGWEQREDEDDLARQMRGIVVSALGGVGADPAVRAEAVRRFEAGNYGGDLAMPILGVVARNGDPDHYRLMLERFKNPPTPQDEQRLLFSLPGFDVEEVVDDLLPRCFGEIRSQDAPAVLSLLDGAAGERANGLALLHRALGRGAVDLPGVPAPAPHVGGCPTYITDPAFADEVEAFHRAHDDRRPAEAGRPADRAHARGPRLHPGHPAAVLGRRAERRGVRRGLRPDVPRSSCPTRRWSPRS